MRHLLLIIAMTLAATAPAAGQTLSADSVVSVLSKMPLHDVEGLWQLTAEGATVVIWRAAPDGIRAETAAPDIYEMVLVDSPDRTWRPGTRLGTITATAQPNTFDARLYTKPSSPTSSGKPRRYTLKLVDRAHLTFTKVNKGIAISPLILFPHLFRRGIKIKDDRQPDLDGCVKIFPREPIKGIPRYL